MNLNIDQFIRAHPLAWHPVLNETFAFKIAYIHCLEMIGTHKTDVYAWCRFNIYNKALLKGYHYQPPYSTRDCLRIIWNRLEYRASLLTDMFHVSGAFANKTIADNIITLLKLMLDWNKRWQIDELASYIKTASGNIVQTYHGHCMYTSNTHALFPQRRIIVTATMGAGKSTLINALVGKPINLTKNLACTAKIHYIYDKAFDDGYMHKWDYEMTFEADLTDFYTNDERNALDNIHAALYFQMISPRTVQLCLIDTPGVNYSQDKSHSKITMNCLEKQEYDVLLWQYLPCILRCIGTNKGCNSKLRVFHRQ
jgi:hypothetical protein